MSFKFRLQRLLELRAQHEQAKARELAGARDVADAAHREKDEIAKLPQDEISVNIIHRGVGGINESDVMLAAASDAIILGFLPSLAANSVHCYCFNGHEWSWVCKRCAVTHVLSYV